MNSLFLNIYYITTTSNKCYIPNVARIWGGGRKKRSNRKSFKAVMSGGSVLQSQQLSTDNLCNLIYQNATIKYLTSLGYWYYYDASDDMRGQSSTFTLTPAQNAILNGISSQKGMTPLYTACRSHSSIELIQLLITNTANLNQLCGDKNKNNTAAHAVTYSDKRIDVKFQILKMFYDSQRFDFRLFNIKGESVGDMLYELENDKLKLLINGLPFIILNKYNKPTRPIGVFRVNTAHVEPIKFSPIPNIDELCNLIYRNTPIGSSEFNKYWTYTPYYSRNYTFTLTDAQRAILNAISVRGMTPLYTACRNHLSIELIQFLITNTTDINQLCGEYSNTAAHAVTYSNKSIDVKFQILQMFNESRRFNFSIFNKNKESVGDMLYELENNNLKLLINTLPFRRSLLFNKHIESMLPIGWVHVKDHTSGNFYYHNTQTNHTQWEQPI